MELFRLGRELAKSSGDGDNQKSFMGFDCASENEFKQLLSLKIPPENLIFANPNKFKPHFKAAKKLQVDRLVFDNLQELKKGRKCLSSTGSRAARTSAYECSSLRSIGRCAFGPVGGGIVNFTSAA